MAGEERVTKLKIDNVKKIYQTRKGEMTEMCIRDSDRGIQSVSGYSPKLCGGICTGRRFSRKYNERAV